MRGWVDIVHTVYEGEWFRWDYTRDKFGRMVGGTDEGKMDGRMWMDGSTK